MRYVQWVIIGTLLILCFFLYESKIEAESRSKGNIEALNSQIVTYKDKLGRSVAEKKALEITKSELSSLNDSLRAAIKGIKPTVIVKWKTRTVYDTTHIKLDSIPCDFNAPFSFEDEWLRYNGVVSNKGLRMDNVEFFQDISLVQGMKRKNFFHPYYQTTRIINNNPHTEVSGMKTYVVKVQTKWYDKWYVHVVAGFALAKIIEK